jgi:hypothetical protein
MDYNINNSMRASHSYTFITRYFSVSITYLGLINLMSGLFIAILST